MANMRILASEEMVGYGHGTKADTLNRLAMIEHNEDGTHNATAMATLIALGITTLPLGYLSGLTIAHAADTEHDITVAVGEARDATDAADMVLASAITKRFDAEFAVGSTNGGFAAGESLPASGTIHVWLIKRADTGVVDVFANDHATSGLTPTLPTGYTYKRRIFSLRTDASNNILNGDQWGTGLVRTFMYDTPILDVNTANPGTNAVTAALSVPGGIIVQAIIRTQVGTTTFGIATWLSNTDVDPTAATALSNIGGAAASPNNQVQVFTNTSSQIRYRLDADQAMHISTAGWEDSL